MNRTGPTRTTRTGSGWIVGEGDAEEQQRFVSGRRTSAISNSDGTDIAIGVMLSTALQDVLRSVAPTASLPLPTRVLQGIASGVGQGVVEGVGRGLVTGLLVVVAWLRAVADPAGRVP